MPNYWAIAPFNSGFPEVWDAIWKFDFENDVISIGWGELGDVSALDEVEIRKLLCEEWPDYLDKAGAATNTARMLHKFYHSINTGDIVIARQGLKKVAGIGTVTRVGYFDPEKLKSVFGQFGDEYEAITFPNHLDIEWHPDSEIECEDRVFGLATLQSVTEETYFWLTDDAADGLPPEDEEQEFTSQTEFAKESYLEDFIVSNFESIFHDSKLALIGRQHKIDVGIIDILAKDLQTDSLVVIELKKGRQADRVVGQILRYMGWVKENLCEGNQEVVGIIICKDSDVKLGYALKMVSNVSVKYYSVDFKLQDNPPSP